MNIDQEKMIVEALPSLYPLQEFEEKAIDTVLNAITKWIPVTERLPKDEGFYIVTLEHRYGAETNIRFFKIENGERYWSLWGNENITAWMPKPEPYKPTVPPECEGDCGWCKTSVIEKCKGVTT